MGINTANLQGKYFDVKVREQQEVQAGDILVEVDLAGILKEGYSLITPVIITNSASYLDVLANEESGIIVKGEPLLTVLK